MSRGKGKKRKTMGDDGSIKHKEDQATIEAEITKLAALVGPIETEKEVAEFSRYVSLLDETPQCKYKREAYQEYLNRLGDREDESYQQMVWHSISMYELIGASPGYFLKKSPAHLFSRRCIEELLGIAGIFGGLALEGRLEILAEHESVMRAMEIRGRTRGGEMLKAYMAVFKAETGFKEWTFERLRDLACHVYRKAYGEEVDQETPPASRALAHRSSTFHGVNSSSSVECQDSISAVAIPHGSLNNPSGDQSIKIEESEDEDIQQDEDIYDDETLQKDDNRYNEPSPDRQSHAEQTYIEDNSAEALEARIVTSAAHLASCLEVAMTTTFAANKARKQYKDLDGKLIEAFKKALAENEQEGFELTQTSLEAKLTVVWNFVAEKVDKIQAQFGKPLIREKEAKRASETAKSAHEALLDRRETM